MEKKMYWKYYAGVMLLAALVGTWIVTQMVAADCQYNQLLGGISFGGVHIYLPISYYIWKMDPHIAQAIPYILVDHVIWQWVSMFAGLMICCILYKHWQVQSSHGTAAFAKAADIQQTGIDAIDSGVTIGRNPFNNRLMLDNGEGHVFLGAPTGSGKGVGLIITTGITWKNSAFFFDPKAELWTHTAGYRRQVLKQRVIKFEPLCKDGSTAHWNPFSEINFQSVEEISDVSSICIDMIKTGVESKKDPFWDDAPIALIKGVIVHLLYKNHREHRRLPCPSDVMSWISTPGMDTDHLFAGMQIYPHISPEEFLQTDYEETTIDADGKNITVTKRHHNPLYEIYGEYITDLGPFKEALHLDKKQAAEINTLEELRQAILNSSVPIDWSAPEIEKCIDIKEIQAILTMNPSPFYRLLVHPTVAESAASVLNGAKETRASVIQSVQTALALYQDPLIKKNTLVSDFCFKDLLNPMQAISIYFVVQPKDIPKVCPLSRLFINMMLAKTVKDMKFPTLGKKSVERQRLLLLLDEFPQLKKMPVIENDLAICRSYGIKMFIVSQSTTQLSEIYTQNNSILDNCPVQVYFAPAKQEAAKALSDTLGDGTIKSVSHSSNGKLIGGDSQTVSHTGRKLMTPDEIMRMDKNDELVIVPGCRPIMAKKIHWFKEKFFKQRATLPAPILSDTGTQVSNYVQLFAMHAQEDADIKNKQAIVAAARIAQEKAMDTCVSQELSVEEDDQIAASVNTSHENVNPINKETTSEEVSTEVIQEELQGTLLEGARSESSEEVINPLIEVWKQKIKKGTTDNG